MMILLALLLAVVNSPNPSVSYSCDGSTAAYTVNYPYLAYTDLLVTSITPAGAATTLAYTTDWTVNLASTSSTATLTLNSPSTKCPSGNILKIYRNPALTQPTSFKAQTTYNQTLHEQAYDRVVMQIQEVKADDRAYADSVFAAGLTSSPMTWTVTGTGAATVFALVGATVTDTQAYQVTIDGVMQRPTTDYSVNSVTQQVTFTAAPALNANIMVRSLSYVQALQLPVYLAPYVGAVARQIPSKLSDAVSVKDFGATGDGVTDDSIAIANTIAAAGPRQLIDFTCPGNYKTTLYGIVTCGDYYPPAAFTGGYPRSLPQKIIDIVDVKDFGAKGDGTTDDTTAIQNAVNAYSRVIVPPGVYKISAAIALPSGHRIFGGLSNVSGEGAWLNQTASDYHITIVGTAIAYNQYSEVTGLTFTGASGKGIRTAFTESLSIHDNIFSGTVYGLYMSTNASEQDVKMHVYRNIFSAITNSGIWGGDTRTADIWVNENTFIDVAAYAIRLGLMDGGFIVFNGVFSSLSSGTENVGFYINQPIWARISDNQLFQVNGLALRVSSPRWTHVERNTAVWTGQTSRAAAFSVVQYASNVSNDVWISENVARQTYGVGFSIDPGVGAGTDYEISRNSVNEAGYTASSLVHDGFLISNITRLNLFRNRVDGNSKTRYWANFQNIAGAQIDQNTNQTCVNAAAFYNTGLTAINYKSTAVSTANATRSLALHEGYVTSDSSGGVATLTLPSALVAAAGKRITITKIDTSANNVVVTTTGGQTISGAASFNLTGQYKMITVYSDGANWLVESVGPTLGTPVLLTGQTANLAATNVYAAAPAGEWRVCANARTTTSGTGTTATLNIIWTDEGGVKTDLIGTWALNSVTVTGQINKCEYIHAAAASNIQVSVTAGTYGTSVYAISATAERLN